MCEASDSEIVGEVAGYIGGTRFLVNSCRVCDASSARPIDQARNEGPQLYEKIYAQADQLPGYERYVRFAKEVLKRSNPIQFLAQRDETYWAIQHYLKEKDPEAHKILEIGSGLGYLTYAIHKAGFDVVGLDISDEAVRAAVSRYGPLFTCGSAEDFLAKSEARFDSIILTEVVEHVADVYELLSSSRRLLKAGGSIVLTTPNKSSYPAGSVWRTELPPVHLWWFSEKSIAAVSKRLSMGVEFTDFTTCSSLNLTRVPGLGSQREAQDSVLDPSGRYLPPSGYVKRLKLWMYRSGISELASAIIYRVPAARRLFLTGERRVSLAARLF